MKNFILVVLLFLTGSCACSARAQTVSGGTVGGGTISRGTAPDTTKPTLTSISSSVTSTTATVTWTSNEVADTQICRGASGGPYNTCTTLDSTMALSHSATFTGLSASTQYFYVVKSSDPSSNQTICATDSTPRCPSGTELTFTTSAAGSNPLYGNTSKTTVLVPPNYYLLEISSFSGNGSTCTVDVTSTFSPHGLVTNDKVKVWAGSTADVYATPSGSIETVASAPDSDTFTFNCSSSATGSGGWAVKMLAWNDGDVYTEEAALGSTPVRRLGNYETGADWKRVAYSTWYAVSPDGTKAIVAGNGGGGWNPVVVNTAYPFTIVVTSSQMGSAGINSEYDSPRWKDNNTIVWFESTNGNVRKLDLTTSPPTASTYGTISGCNALSTGISGDFDGAVDKIALRCYNGTSYDWFVYTYSTNTKGSVYNSGSNGGDFAQILDDGNFLIFTGTAGTSGFTGTILIDGSTGAYIKSVANVNPHGTARRAPDGSDYLFLFDNGLTGSPCTGGIVSIKISDLTKTCLWNVTNIGTDRTLGVTSGSGANSGWVLISYQGTGSGRVFSQANTWKANWTNVLASEIAYVKWDGSAVYRFVHHWGRPGAYNSYPHASLNRDGTVVIYNSWMFCNSTIAPACLPDGNNVRGMSIIKPFTSGNP